MIEYYNEDCMIGMKRYPDKYFELAIVDPPYGIGECGGDKKRGRKKDNYRKIVIHERKDWDNAKPSSDYFNELERVSKNQIIWGGNYFVEYLQPHMGWVYWDKLIGGDFSDGELAYTSFDRALRKFTYSHHGDTMGGHTRIHPTQKPIALYRYLLTNYAKPGDKILDTHVGSASSLIACYDLGFDAVGFELDADYYRMSKQRLADFIRQPKITEYIDQFEQIRMGDT